jgi:ankyrin repeat protein
MRIRMVVVVLAVLLAASAYAQTTDFFELVKTGTPDDVQAALQKGANVNAQVTTGTPQELHKAPLSYAAQYNKDPEVITALLKAGADVNEMDTLQETALMLAAKFNPNPDVIATLLRAGADARANIVGWTPLMKAASHNQNPEVITILLKAGADIKAKGENGWNALEYAAAGNPNPEVIITLLKAGADAKAKDNNGQTALDYAQNNFSLQGTDALKKLEEASQ